MAYHYKSANQPNALFCCTKGRAVGVASPDQTGGRRAQCAQWQVCIDRFLVLTPRNSVAAWLAQRQLWLIVVGQNVQMLDNGFKGLARHRLQMRQYTTGCVYMRNGQEQGGVEKGGQEPRKSGSEQSSNVYENLLRACRLLGLLANHGFGKYQSRLGDLGTSSAIKQPPVEDRFPILQRTARDSCCARLAVRWLDCTRRNSSYSSRLPRSEVS